MVPDVVSEHEVQEFGHLFENGRLEHIARVGSDSSLTQAHEDCQLQTLAGRNYLVIDDLL